MLSGSRIFFNGRVVAEALPHGLFRFTQAGKESRSASLMVSPLAGRATIKGKTLDFKPVALISEGLYELYREGEALLREHGVEVREDPGDRRKLSNLVRKLEARTPEDPFYVSRGSRLAILSHHRGWRTLQVIHYTGGHSVEESLHFCLEGDDPVSVTFYENGSTRIEGSSKGHWYAGPNDRLVRITKAEHAWLRSLAHFHRAPRGADDPAKLLRTFTNSWPSREDDFAPQLPEGSRLGDTFL